MKPTLKIGTRESELAVWQATLVQTLLKDAGFSSELIYIKSEGDINLVTPLYELGVQGIFTKTLDAALLNNKIDIAVHSMKDVPTQLAKGIKQAAVLKRASYKDVLVYKEEAIVDNWQLTNDSKNFSLQVEGIIATSSIRRKAQWLHRYPNHTFENLRGNINTRIKKLNSSNWNGAIFAAAGLERINLRPENSVDLNWMLPAPAQGAIMVVCREDDTFSFDACKIFNDAETALCTKLERDFLRTLLGGCSTPISALAEIKDDVIIFKGNICSVDGKEKIEIEKESSIEDGEQLGIITANEILKDTRAQKIIHSIRNEKS
jgi:hydroxymethylbilane synthase